ncbi:contractile injection system tape measure protein [uncultured Shewanella sp.]|uniref:contractile injection system tape measure protein n=1 Tax=uncultured Shewanella sp. TaxID=173975 RepID=UPI0026315A3E|nr:contractile injection system tape measure protein [uncultured Shewanella sp.]
MHLVESVAKCARVGASPNQYSVKACQFMIDEIIINVEFDCGARSNLAQTRFQQFAKQRFLPQLKLWLKDNQLSLPRGKAIELDVGEISPDSLSQYFTQSVIRQLSDRAELVALQVENDALASATFEQELNLHRLKVAEQSNKHSEFSLDDLAHYLLTGYLARVYRDLSLLTELLTRFVESAGDDIVKVLTKTLCYQVAQKRFESICTNKLLKQVIALIAPTEVLAELLDMCAGLGKTPLSNVEQRYKVLAALGQALQAHTPRDPWILTSLFLQEKKVSSEQLVCVENWLCALSEKDIGWLRLLVLPRLNRSDYCRYLVEKLSLDTVTYLFARLFSVSQSSMQAYLAEQRQLDDEKRGDNKSEQERLSVKLAEFDTLYKKYGRLDEAILTHAVDEKRTQENNISQQGFLNRLSEYCQRLQLELQSAKAEILKLFNSSFGKEEEPGSQYLTNQEQMQTVFAKLVNGLEQVSKNLQQAVLNNPELKRYQAAWLEMLNSIKSCFGGLATGVHQQPLDDELYADVDGIINTCLQYVNQMEQTHSQTHTQTHSQNSALTGEPERVDIACLNLHELQQALKREVDKWHAQMSLFSSQDAKVCTKESALASIQVQKAWVVILKAAVIQVLADIEGSAFGLEGTQQSLIKLEQAIMNVHDMALASVMILEAERSYWLQLGRQMQDSFAGHSAIVNLDADDTSSAENISQFNKLCSALLQLIESLESILTAAQRYQHTPDPTFIEDALTRLQQLESQTSMSTAPVYALGLQLLTPKKEAEVPLVDVSPTGDSRLPLIKEQENTNPGETKTHLPVGESGLVIIWPYLSQLFTQLQWLNKEQQFKQSTFHERAAYWLYQLCHGKAEPVAACCPLINILLNLPADSVIDDEIELSEQESNAVNQLFTQLAQHWPAPVAQSSEQIQRLFFKRQGSLIEQASGYRLQVKPQLQDVLLNTLPWPYETVVLPWMSSHLHVEWSTHD